MAKEPVTDLKRQLADLSPAKRALLEKKRKRADVSWAAPAILPREKRDRAPLSFAQQRLWLIQQLDPASCLYNVPRAIRINGPLNVSALEQSLNEIVRRHEVLRTTFVIEDDQPVQEIAPEMKTSLALVHL